MQHLSTPAMFSSLQCLPVCHTSLLFRCQWPERHTVLLEPKKLSKEEILRHVTHLSWQCYIPREDVSLAWVQAQRACLQRQRAQGATSSPSGPSGQDWILTQLLIERFAGWILLHLGEHPGFKNPGNGYGTVSNDVASQPYFEVQC